MENGFGTKSKLANRVWINIGSYQYKKHELLQFERVK